MFNIREICRYIESYFQFFFSHHHRVVHVDTFPNIQLKHHPAGNAKAKARAKAKNPRNQREDVANALCVHAVSIHLVYS